MRLIRVQFNVQEESKYLNYRRWLVFVIITNTRNVLNFRCCEFPVETRGIVSGFVQSEFI